MDRLPSDKVTGAVQPQASPTRKWRGRLLASPPLATPAPGKRPGQLRRTKTPRPKLQPELLGGDPIPNGNPIPMSELIDAVPLEPSMSRFTGTSCHCCTRMIAKGETFWTCRPDAPKPHPFCFQCGIAIGLELGHHPDVDLLTIPAYGGGPRR